MTDDLCLNSYARRALAVYPLVAGAKAFAKSSAGKKILKKLFKTILKDLASQVDFEAIFGVDFDPAEEDNCEARPSVDFCFKHIDHHVFKDHHEDRLMRDVKAHSIYNRMQADPQISMILENSVCNRVIQQHLCNDAFPPCDCSEDRTACKQACENVNECAKQFDQLAETVCFSCSAYCERICEDATSPAALIKGTAPLFMFIFNVIFVVLNI